MNVSEWVNNLVGWVMLPFVMLLIVVAVAYLFSVAVETVSDIPDV